MKITINGVSLEAADVSLVIMGRNHLEVDNTKRELKRVFKKAGAYCPRHAPPVTLENGGILLPIRFTQDHQS